VYTVQKMVPFLLTLYTPSFALCRTTAAKNCIETVLLWYRFSGLQDFSQSFTCIQAAGSVIVEIFGRRVVISRPPSFVKQCGVDWAVFSDAVGGSLPSVAFCVNSQFVCHTRSIINGVDWLYFFDRDQNVYQPASS